MDGLDDPRLLMEANEYLTELPQDYEVISAQLERYSRAAYGTAKWSKEARDCLNFIEGNQWTEAERAILSNEGRPCLTKNKLASLLRLLSGYQRQNRFDLSFLPAQSGSGSTETAKALTATAKMIAEQNQMPWVASAVYDMGISTGRGWFDCRLSFAKNALGDVCITDDDPFCILPDPEAESYDPNDLMKPWQSVTEIRWMSPTEIFLLYGAKALADVTEYGQEHVIRGDELQVEQELFLPEKTFSLDVFSDMANYNNNPSLYYSGAHHINKNRKLVRVIETQHRVLKKVKVFVDIETGAEKILPDAVDERMIQRVMQFAQLKGLPVTIEEKYKRMVRWTTTAGCKVLWDEWSPYGYMMTKIPYFPYFRRGVTRGAFHDLLDPQREINRRYNAMLHIIMTTANSGWIYEKGSLDDDMERALEQEGARPGINIVYEKGASQPSRIQPPAPPTTFERLIQMNERDLYDISSINESALGQLDKVQSGRAVQARQQQTLIGTQVYADNFSRSQELLGRLIKHNIQNFYTEPRIVQSVAGNGATEEIVINARTAAGEIVNNVAWGDYQVAIDESPMSATFLNAQFEDAKALRQEMGIPLPDDYMIELSNLPNKEEVLLRLNEDRQMAVQERMLNIVGARASMGLPENMPLPPVPVGDQAIVSVGSAPQGQPVAPENSMVPLRPEVTPI